MTIDPNGATANDNRGTLAGDKDGNDKLERPGASAVNKGYPGRLRTTRGLGGGLNEGPFDKKGATVRERTILLADGTIVAEVDLAVTFAPGDNFRVVASFNQAEVAALKNDANTTDVPTEGDVAAGGFTGKTSSQLSVWRRLHVEKDSMGKVKGNTVKGKITKVVPDPADNAQSICSTDQKLDPTKESPNRFQNGNLTDKTVARFGVAESKVDKQGNIIVTVTNAGDNNTVTPTIGAFSLLDDDGLKDGDQVPVPDLSTLKPALADAYIEPTVLDIANKNIPFVLNVNTELQARNLQSVTVGGVAVDSWSTAPLVDEVFWVVYVLGAFQGPAVPGGVDFQGHADADPDDEQTVFGFSHNLGGVLVFVESIRDNALFTARTLGVAGLTPDTLQRDTVVHEVGHAVSRFGGEPVTDAQEALLAAIRNPDDAAVVKKVDELYGRATGTRYLPIYVAKVRESTKPRER